MSKRLYHHGNLKEELVIKALALVEKSGDVHFTLRDLAKACGVSVTAVYRHFPSKDDLLVDIAFGGFSKLKDVLEQPRFNSKSLTGLADIGRAYVDFAIENEGLFRIMFDRALTGLPEFRRAKPRRDEAFMVLVNVMMGGSHISFKDGCRNPEILSQWSLVHGLSTLWLDRNLDLTKSDFIKLLSKIFLKDVPESEL